MDKKYTYIEFMQKFFPNDNVTCPECGAEDAVLVSLCQCKFNHKSWACSCGHRWADSDDKNSFEYISSSHAPTILAAYGVVSEEDEQEDDHERET